MADPQNQLVRALVQAAGRSELIAEAGKVAMEKTAEVNNHAEQTLEEALEESRRIRKQYAGKPDPEKEELKQLLRQDLLDTVAKIAIATNQNLVREVDRTGKASSITVDEDGNPVSFISGMLGSGGS
jgi:hypothetical protein